MPYKNRDDQRAAQRRWYRGNATKAKSWIMGRRRRLASWLKGIKGALACEQCGESHIAALDFHHRDTATKGFTIQKAIRWGWGRPRILQEIDKCDVLCSNCHRKLHWGSRPTEQDTRLLPA